MKLFLQAKKKKKAPQKELYLKGFHRMYLFFKPSYSLKNKRAKQRKDISLRTSLQKSFPSPYRSSNTSLWAAATPTDFCLDARQSDASSLPTLTFVLHCGPWPPAMPVHRHRMWRQRKRLVIKGYGQEPFYFIFCASVYILQFLCLTVHSKL